MTATFERDDADVSDRRCNSRLTEMGLPTPNFWTGGRNFHGKTEWLSIEDMGKSLEAAVHLVQIWVEKSRQ